MTKPKPKDDLPPSTSLFLLNELHAVERRALERQIADLQDQLREARARSTNGHLLRPLAEEEDDIGSGDKEENPLRKSNPTQWIMDSLEEQIPLSNDQARNTLRSWVDRQLRLRGRGSIDEILMEAVQGDVTDLPEEEAE